jgi:hypothetical protein
MRDKGVGPGASARILGAQLVARPFSILLQVALGL